MSEPIVRTLASVASPQVCMPYDGVAGAHLFTATVSGSGSVSAAVAVEGSNDLIGWASIVTLSPSGSGSAVASASTSNSYRYVRANVSAVTGQLIVKMASETVEADVAVPPGMKPVYATLSDQGNALPLNRVVQNVGSIYPAAPRFDNTATGIGDSIMRAQGVNNSLCSFMEYAAIVSQGAMKLVDNKGVNGNKTSDILARITDVTGSYARWVFVMEAANDALQGVSVSAHRANMLGTDLNPGIIPRILAAGQTPIIVGAPPVNNYNVFQFNLCDQDLARQYGLPYVNPWLACVADGKWIDTTFALDGVHPTAKASRIAGAALWAFLSKLICGSPDLAWTNADPDGMFSNCLFTTAGGTNGAPNGWTGAANVTHALEAGTADVLGNWWKQTASGITGWAVSSRTGLALPSGWLPGDAVRLSCRVRTVGVEANGNAANSSYPMSNKMGAFISFNWGGVTDKLILRGVEADVNGVISIDGIIPAGTSGTSAVQIVVYQTATVSGEVSFAQLQMHNLSRAGRI